MTKTSKKNEKGMVSFLVVSVIVTLLALVTIGFSHLMGRETRQALDRQLSDEAYYAAESGLNDARNYLNSGGVSSTGCPAPSSVSPTPFVAGGNLSPDGIVRYSCVSIDAQPKELIYNLKAGETISFKATLASLNTMYFGWQNQTYNGVPQPLGSFQTLPREDQLPADATGVLRVGIYPVTASSSAAGADTNAVLGAASRSYLLYPDGGAGTVGSVNYTPGGSNGAFIHGNCNSSTHPSLPFPNSTPRYCNARVTGLGGTATTYYVRLSAKYTPLSVSVQTADSGGTALSIPNVEGIIDVTGAGNDVLQRIQARVPLASQYANPGYGLQSMQAICKVFRAPVPSQGRYGQPSNDPAVPNDDNTCATPFNSGAITSGGIPPLTDLPCPAGQIGSYPNCLDPPPPPPAPAPTPAPTPPPPPPEINYWVWNSSYAPGDGFIYNVTNSNTCTIYPDSGGSVTIGPALNQNFGVTDGHPYSGAWLWCYDQGVGPAKKYAPAGSAPTPAPAPAPTTGPTSPPPSGGGGGRGCALKSNFFYPDFGLIWFIARTASPC